MKENLYIGIDLGTTKIKVGVFDTCGRQLAIQSDDFYFNSAGDFAEFNIDSYINVVYECIRKAITDDEVCASKVRGISVASQAQTFILMGDDYKPLRPAISWLDVRAKQDSTRLSEISKKELNCSTDAIASGPKISWIARNEPDVFRKTRYVTLLPDYLIFKLTGRRISDIRTAESTGLYDRFAGKWVWAMLDACGLKEEMMSDVGRPGQLAGSLRTETAKKLGLSQSVIVAVGAMDQLAGAVGAGNVEPGCASVNIGTALPIIISAKSGQNKAERACMRPHPVQGLDALLAYTKTAGIVLRWFKENFADSLSYEDLFVQIAKLPVGSEGVRCVPHFCGTATPKFDPSVRGMFSGISLNHGRFHIARSIIEALCFSIKENIETLSRLSERIKFIRAIGGGAQSDVWLQMIANSTGIQVDRPVIMEACSFGAAQFAMVADKVFEDIAKASTMLYKNDKSFYPDSNTKKQYDGLFADYKAFYQSIGLI